MVRCFCSLIAEVMTDILFSVFTGFFCFIYCILKIAPLGVT